jgi:hypothetical protein
MFLIRNLEFTGFPGRDVRSGHLQQLDYRERVAWLQHRTEFVFLTPFRDLVAREDEHYVWLCAVHLLCAAVEALASFEPSPPGHASFIAFVERYFPEFPKHALTLDDPQPRPSFTATRPAEHLFKFFRSGLTHSFCIEWGGLQHAEEGGGAYLFATRQGINGERGLGIAPRELVADFLHAVENFFTTLSQRTPPSPETEAFDRRFADVFLKKVAPPLP